MTNLSSTLSGRVAVVTGGANGIGLAAAKRFKALGATVLIGDVQDDALAVAGKENGFETLRCDVSQEADLAQLADKAKSLGPIGVVMANAGVALGGKMEHIPLSEWQRVLDINVVGVVRTFQPFLETLMDQKSGHIIVTGSSASLRSDPSGMNAPYATTKTALIGMTRALHNYLKPHDVSVHLLAPRMTDTAFPRKALGWGRKGSRVAGDYDIGVNDTPDQVADALIKGMEAGDYLISLLPETKDVLRDFAETHRP